jgi:hypothetical protein
MSLLDNAYEDFTIINKSIVDDGYGGTTTVWTDGATIKGVMVFDNSTQMKVAQAMGVTSAYTFTVQKSVALDFHTVLRRESDAKVFRLTSNSDDKKTPEEAGLNMRQYSAEEWKVAT